MSDSTKHYLVTTPIYYVTAAPHLGSLYSTLLADVFSRWQQMHGQQVFFLTGTDEHGQKVSQAAQDAGMQPQAFVDKFIPAFVDVWHKYQIDYSKFIRTTNVQHWRGVQEFVKKLMNSGDIYQSHYEGWYCTPCETFIVLRGSDKDIDKPACSSCGRPTAWLSERAYFFRLSAYQDRLLDFYKKNPNFMVPRERLNEVTSFVQEGLKDLSISRTSVPWGIPFPDDAEHTIYVWVDALCNYITAIGYGYNQEQFEQNWPADLQILGKDIVRFHAVYWPALLMAAELSLPKRLLVHGWIRVDKQKMSKSFGNVVDPVVLYEKYGADSVRYYLCRQIPINQDGDFSIADLEQRIESDLANDLGNLLNRLVVLANGNEVYDLPAPTQWGKRECALRDETLNVIQDVTVLIQDCTLHLALARVWELVAKTNSYFHEQEPWRLAKTDKEHFVQVLSATAHALRAIGVLLWPVMPGKMTDLLKSLGAHGLPTQRTVERLELGVWRHAFLLKRGAPLFQKPVSPNNEIPTLQQSHKEAKMAEQIIAFEDFLKVNLRVGTVEVCERIEESDKLLKLMVNLGELGIKQIIAGVAKHYEPSDLMGQQVVVVSNLKPRMMMGTYESQGMLLLVEDGEKKPQFVWPTSVVPNGTLLK